MPSDHGYLKEIYFSIIRMLQFRCKYAIRIYFIKFAVKRGTSIRVLVFALQNSRARIT